ncbi:uncharacterized protein LOC100899732 [Galendromus occidentalis]|uniref:Uncharacterized protein LOC100899732 n=1 Tax=Galendromus occidentalis TaxID=34638 RepID=A0AAJ6QMM1_9ACAR|nr:uncharacterized protein LOC100899732 [Galendromus occidentalis]
MVWFLTAALCLTVPAAVVVQGQTRDCELGPKKITSRPPAFSLGDLGKSIAIWSEVTVPAVKETYVVREVFDKESDRYFLEFYDDKKFWKVLVDRKLDLYYTYTDDKCNQLEKKALADFLKRNYLFKALGLFEVPDSGFLGPASLFDAFANGNGEVGGFNNCEDFDRLIPCEKYNVCKGGEITYWYSDKNYQSSGQAKSRPLRLRMAVGVTVDILSTRVFDKSQDLFIPTGLSCMNSKCPHPKMPFDTGRRSFVGEVVIKTDSSDYTLVSQLNGLVIPAPDSKPDDSELSGIYSFSMSTFRIDTNGIDIVPSDRYQVIHDIGHNVVYERFTKDDPDDVALQQTTCKILSGEDFHLELQIPPYGSIDLEPIFLRAPVDASGSTVTHLEQNRIGSTKTDVYEVTFSDLYTGNGYHLDSLVATYHMSTTVKSQIVAVELNAFNTSYANVFTATIYLSKYDNEITQLNEKLRVDDCPAFLDKSESRWLEIKFNDGSFQNLAQIEKSAFQIRDAFTEKLYRDFGVDPMRIPQVNVDFVDQSVVVNALLLERPMLYKAFNSPLMKDFSVPSRVLGVMSQPACMIACLGMRENECTAITYCGATCSISDLRNPSASAHVKDSRSCELYERAFDREIPVSSRILLDLKRAVTTTDTREKLSLKFQVDAVDGSSEKSQVEITALEMDDTKNYDSAFHYDENKVAVVETSFKIAAASSRFKHNEIASLGSLDLEVCAIACKNRQNCESFSYCMNSMECIISEYHDVPSGRLEEDNECIAYQRKYTDRFERFPGLTAGPAGAPTKATNADSCAQKCIGREDCKSFEFCQSTGDCFFLNTHIADASVVAKASNIMCDHYSKKYLFDYTIMPKKRGTGAKRTELANFSNITQATCAKMCSEWSDVDTVCLSFDFCSPAPDNTGLCTLRTVDGRGKPTDSPTCNFFYVTVPPTVGVVKHGAGSAIGLSVLMLFIGAGVAVGSLLLYGRFLG